MATPRLRGLLDELIVANRHSPWVDSETKKRMLSLVEQIAAKPDRPPPKPPPSGLCSPPVGPVSAPNFDPQAGPVTAKLSRKERPTKRVQGLRKNASFLVQNEFYRCTCGADVKRKTEAKHKGKCPKRRASGKRSSRAPRRRSQESSPRRTSPATDHYGSAHTGAEERRLDATTGYAHAFREGGQYGSHASHDDYGEEGHV
jgi:hypothetical protein